MSEVNYVYVLYVVTRVVFFWFVLRTFATALVVSKPFDDVKDDVLENIRFQICVFGTGFVFVMGWLH